MAMKQFDNVLKWRMKNENVKCSNFDNEAI
jgi:hypothetical protein